MALRNRAAQPVPVERMVRSPRVGELEIITNERYLRGEWRAQRVGWALLALLIGVSLTGLLGGYGPLNQRTLPAGRGVELEVERVVRHSGEARLSLHVPAAVVPGETFEVWVDRSWWQGMSLETNPMPEPESTRVSGDRVVFEFAAADPDAPSRVEFTLTPDTMWLRRGAAGLVDGPSVSFTQLVLP